MELDSRRTSTEQATRTVAAEASGIRRRGASRREPIEPQTIGPMFPVLSWLLPRFNAPGRRDPAAWDAAHDMILQVLPARLHLVVSSAVLLIRDQIKARRRHFRLGRALTVNLHECNFDGYLFEVACGRIVGLMESRGPDRVKGSLEGAR